MLLNLRTPLCRADLAGLELLDRPLEDQVLLQLGGDGAGQVVGEDHALGALVAGQPLADVATGSGAPNRDVHADDLSLGL